MRLDTALQVKLRLKLKRDEKMQERCNKFLGGKR